MNRRVGVTIAAIGAVAGLWAGFEIMSSEGTLRRIAPVAIGCFAILVVPIVGRYQGRQEQRRESSPAR